jgi:hypothetical protein
MEKSYLEQRDGGYWVMGTRISLDSIVYAFKPVWRPSPYNGRFRS